MSEGYWANSHWADSYWGSGYWAGGGGGVPPVVAPAVVGDSWLGRDVAATRTQLKRKLLAAKYFLQSIIGEE